MNLDVGVARTRPKSDGIASATWAEVKCPGSGNVGDGVDFVDCTSPTVGFHRELRGVQSPTHSFRKMFADRSSSKRARGSANDDRSATPRHGIFLERGCQDCRMKNLF